MTPEYRAALYALIENAVDGSTSDSALYETHVPHTSRSQVSETKTIKIISGPGRFNFGAEDENRAIECLFTIQCWVRPTAETDDDYEDALDLAMEMAEAVFNAIHNDQSLGGTVCLVDADDYDAEFANHGGMRKAVAYLDGVINPVGVQG